MDEAQEFDAAGVLAAAGDVVRRRRLLEVEDLDVLAAWAGLHSVDPLEGLEGPERRHGLLSGNVLVRVGGEGTPWVQDFCLGEIALVRGTGVGATTSAMADRLDLEFRLPETWAVCREGGAEVSIARRVAKLSRHLPADRVGVVDRAVARIIATESGGRVLAVAEAKIIEADPVLHQERVEAERRRRYVSSGRTDEFGMRTLIARCEAGDAVWVEAIVARVAQIIAPQHPEASVDELRSIAFGWLARPAELLALLLEHRDTRDPQDELDLAIEQEEVVDRGESRATAFPADLLDALREVDLTPLAPRAVLYVHLHEAALQGAGGVARVEGLGPMTLASLQGLLSRTRLTVKPVLDLSDRVRTSAYEHPESLKERVYLSTGGDYWPYATSTNRRVDYDHPIPFDDTGPPGQTGTHNSGPLGRRHHRWKTHAGYRARQSGQGRYAWLTPHGLGYLVDHRGTRRIPAKHARMIIDAPAGCDVYPGVEISVTTLRP
jgi:hypothetical protein